MIGAVRGAPYLTHFALREPPFASNAGPHFFYADPARQQCLNMLHHLAEYSEEWLLVSGPAGMGKSTLLDEFIRRANPHLRTCRIDGTGATDGAQLFLGVAGAFGLDLARQNQGDPLDQLRSHLNALHAEQVPLVAVDDADRLGDDALEIILHLADLEGDHGKLIRVVLFADGALQQRLGADRFAQLSRPHLLELRPFDEADAARYLVHRMSIAGYEGANPFDATVVRRIFKESGGLPGAINRCADQRLRQKMGEQSGSGRTPWIRRVLIPVAALAAVTGVGVALHAVLVSPPAAPAQAVATPAVPPPVNPLPISGPVTAETDGPTTGRVAPQAAVEEPVMPQGSGTDAAGPVAQAEAPQPTPVPVTAVAESRTGPSGSAWLKAQNPSHFTLQLLAAAQEATIDDYLKKHPLQGPWARVDATRDGAPLHLLVAGAYATRADAVAAARLHGVEAWPRPIRDLPLPQQPAKDPDGLKNGQWIATREPSRYTLQLVAAEHKQAVLNQLGDDRLPGPTALFATERHGKPFYVAVYGDYPDEASAQHAFAALPARLRQGSPLVREFSALQESLTPKAPLAP